MTAGEDREALRRRLYQPGASRDDLAAYADGYDGGEAARADAPAPSSGGSSSPGRARPPAVLAVLAAACLVGAVVLSRTGGGGEQQTAPAPSPTAAAARAAVRTSTAERTGFVLALIEAQQAGVGTWLDRHAQRLPGVLAQATRSDTLEFAGSGSRTLLLDPPSIGQGGGHVTVLVVTAVDARVTWTLLGDGRGAVAGTRSAVQEAGSLTSASVDWAPGRRPGTLLVVAPDGVRWGVATVYSG